MSSTPPQRPLWKVLLLDIHWTNLFNPRMWWAAFWLTVLALIPLVLVGLPEALIAPFAVVLFFGTLVATCFAPARCAECQGRVRVGATMCRNGHPIGSQS